MFDFEPYHLRAGVGILIHNKLHRNKGYASDALTALSGYAREMLGLKKLYASISAGNKNSIQLFEKGGFVKTGDKKSWLKNFSGWEEECFYQKLLF